MIYPWGQVYFQYRCTFVKKSDWTTRYTRRQPKSAVKKLAVLSALIALLGAGIKYTALGGTLAVLVKQRVPGDYLNRLVQLRTALGM